MKVLLYSEGLRLIAKSGLGRAILHQKKALELNGIPYTTDIGDTSYDVVHINTYLLRSYLLARRAKRKGIPLVYHAHSTREDFRNSLRFSNLLAPLFGRWIVHCYNLGDIVVTPTVYSADLLRRAGVDRPIVPISNGIDVDYYQPSQEKKAAFRRRYSFSEQDKVIMAVGLYLKRKGILEFVELARRMPEYQFIWFGYLNLYQVPNEIRKAVETRLPNLHFPGYVAPDELKEAYSGADLFLFPTYEETEGIVLLEAAAMRQRILIRDIPIYQKEWEHGKNIYKARNTEEFETIIRSIMKGSLPDLTEAAYEKVKQKNLTAIGASLAAVYEQAIQSKSVNSSVDARPR